MKSRKMGKEELRRQMMYSIKDRAANLRATGRGELESALEYGRNHKPYQNTIGGIEK